ncbi:MAG: hypothetical protein EZS28_032235 [Streblomastix strix]|uniref:Uncharacterized protein n=1 Tax=Streblomastix strix TaxID=222440 RepID=A0A5J4UP78_9EUKA|nr:MAG: hypothetical protein EZS28_032235 [Streblomastix strix]
MLICFFSPNEIAEIKLNFLNVNKTENQASQRLAPKQANAIETYEVYEIDNEKLISKLAVYEWVDRLQKQFPKAFAYSIRHSATTELAKLEPMTQQGNQQVIQDKIMKDQTTYLNKEVRQVEKGVINYYPRLSWRQGNDLLSPYLLISPLVQLKYVSKPEVKQKQGENSLEN